FIFALKIFEPGDLDAAGPTPSGPEIQEHHFPFVIREMDHFAAGVFQLEIVGFFAFFFGLERLSRRLMGWPPDGSESHGYTGNDGQQNKKTRGRNGLGTETHLLRLYNERNFELFSLADHLQRLYDGISFAESHDHRASAAGGIIEIEIVAAHQAVGARGESCEREVSL